MNIGSPAFQIEVRNFADVLSLLRTGREAILLDWVGRVRENSDVPAGAVLPVPVLLDHVPQLYDAILDRLEINRDRADAEYFATVHGFGRRVDGYDVVEAVAELAMFRRAVWAHLSAVAARPAGAYAAMELIDGMIDRAVLASVRAFLDPSAQKLERRAEGRDAAG
ncbi:MAG TPA: RsbRD N-terminal domain-containing protein [Longimicrobiaceae bacterium]|nr:RsbRD N-terminal domain-containing protein [Longimicrobiaceae bacterium]